MPRIGMPELILILIVVISILGVGKLLEVARSLGEVVRELGKGNGQKKRSLPPHADSLPSAEGWFARLEKALDEVVQTMGEELTLAAMLTALVGIYKVSQYRLAEDAGVNRSTINKILTGETKKPQKETLLAILEAFPALSPHWRDELLALAGYPSAEARPPLPHAPQVYLSCHGDDLADERQAVSAVLSGPRSLFKVEVGNETWPQDEAAASVRHSDYLVMVQGWRWVELRRAEHRAAQEKEHVTGLYFQKQGLSPASDALEFLEEVGREQWKSFADADTLTEQVWVGLCETLVREARAGRARVSLHGMAAVYLTAQLVSRDQVSLPALLQRLAGGMDKGAGAGKGKPEREPSSETSRRKRDHPLEPKTIPMPAGWFWMGTRRLELELAGIPWQDWVEDETPCRQIYLSDYAIGECPVTNAQYAAFVLATGHKQPRHWEGGRPPRRKEDHPVINVSWHDAVAYCNWLAEVTGKPYRLPSEAQWEKAARGTDGRIYPWGDVWDPRRCNSREGGKQGTMPVGAYPNGASPYGLLDMAGNVWEWMSSLYRPYPYRADDGREDLAAEGRRVVRGGSWGDDRGFARCAYRSRLIPVSWGSYLGVRVVASLALSSSDS